MAPSLIMQEGIMRRRMAAGGFTIKERREINHGTQYRFTDGTIINYYTSGKLLVQGPNPGPALKALESAPLPKKPSSTSQAHAPAPATLETRRMHSEPGEKGAITTPETFQQIGLDPAAETPNRHPDWNKNLDPDSPPF